MLVPIIIFVACFAGGAYAAARWLPDLGEGQVAGLAFFAACGLLAASLGNAGLNVYDIVRDLEGNRFGFGLGGPNAYLLAGGLRVLLLESGTLFGLAVIVYLLAWREQARATATRI
jgi:hypothetical protein